MMSHEYFSPFCSFEFQLCRVTPCSSFKYSIFSLMPGVAVRDPRPVVFVYVGFVIEDDRRGSCGIFAYRLIIFLEMFSASFDLVFIIFVNMSTDGCPRCLMIVSSLSVSYVCSVRYA